MLGTPVTHLAKFSEGNNGYLIVADLDDLFMDEVKSVQFIDELDSSLTTTASEKTDLLTLSSYINTEDTDNLPDAAWSVSSSLLYMFLNSDVFPYESHNLFLAFGYRSGIPISSLNDNIDVPEKHMPLFTKLAIKEAALFLGKQVPPSIIKEIADLETKLV